MEHGLPFALERRLLLTFPKNPLLRPLTNFLRLVYIILPRRGETPNSGRFWAFWKVWPSGSLNMEEAAA